MNKVYLIGNLTRDPELTTTTSGISVCRMSIAVGRRFSNAEGSRETDFFNVTAWRGTADNCAKFLKKGNKIAVSGSIQTRNYEKADGTKAFQLISLLTKLSSCHQETILAKAMKVEWELLVVHQLAIFNLLMTTTFHFNRKNEQVY